MKTHILFSRTLATIIILSLVFANLADTPQKTLADGPCDSPANAIVAENCLAGAPASQWDVVGAGDASIQGFATDISVNRGETIQFKIDTTASEYTIPIYRLGYYGGNGARLVATITPTQVTDQPACTFNADNRNLLDCGNWSVSASWDVPNTATSGVYIARPTRTDTGGASHIVFIVRDDASTSDLLFQTSDTTWQAYNPYGGYNAYGSSGATMAEKLSYNRPFTTRGAELENYLFNAEYPMIRWLERNGYDVSYFSAVDTERHGGLITNHKVFLSVGHDEYWSQGRRDAVTAARDAGVHLAFFSGNEIYWKIRWEDSVTTGTSYDPGDMRIQVTYKEGSAAPSGSAEHRNCYNYYNCDPSDIWTGLWREAPGSTPENALSGQISWRLNQERITVPGEYAAMRFWRNTAVAGLLPGEQLSLAYGTLGYEWDPEYPQYASWYPPGRVLLSTTTATSFTGIPEQHHLSLYRAPSGALVFGAGTVQWSWGLDANHDRDASTEDVNVQQATVNLFADMGVQPATLQAGLVAATASSDTTPPDVTVTLPASGAEVPGGLVTITGTASDTGGVVGVVEISTDGGTTWRRAAGREAWSYTYNATPGAASIRVRAADDSANLSAPLTHNFQVAPRVCPCWIFSETSTPQSPNLNDGNPIELGMKFQSDVDGYVLGVRFYKGSQNTGVHTGHLWSREGDLLAEAAFANETASGWQEVRFNQPVFISKDTTYLVSYYSPTGYYSIMDPNGFASALINPPLRALAFGQDGPNGVYRYGASGFPTQFWTGHAPDYGVDVVFDTSLPVYSVWESGAISGNPSVNDPNAIEVGVKFKSDVPGSVIGVAFYKGAANTGSFIGHLWSLAGTQLASKNYTNSSGEAGWQEILFDTPVHIDANTTYVASYFTQSGNYAAANNFFTAEISNPPLRALANSDPDGPNGVFNYGSSGFPQNSYNASNYWVDVLFVPDAPFDNTPPTVLSVTPASGALGVNVAANVTARFSEAMDAATINAGTFELRDPADTPVSAAVSYMPATREAVLNPDANLAYSTTYTARVKGGDSGVKDLAGNPLASDYVWSFTTSAPPPPPPNEGPGGPILVIADAANPFTSYYAEILRTEGFNAFTVTDISNVTASLLADYDLVILGEMALTGAQVTLFSDWVNGGGNLIAMRPDKGLAGLLGLADAGSTLSEAYLLVNTASAPGAGIVNQTIQFHGAADRYTLAGATSIAALYTNATTPTANPAITLRSVGSNGGQAAAFTYDLAKSVVYTRQGNPAWININGDGSPGPVRADDLFHNGTDPDWVYLDKVAIPQADEQQRLLGNLILHMNLDKKPLPRFWYFPRGEKAVVLMTADDHNSSNVAGRLEQYKTASPPGCSVSDWECIRSSIFIYSGSVLSQEQANQYTSEGFEIGAHLDTSCANYTLSGLENFYTTQLNAFAARFPLLPLQASERTHCVAWSGWAFQPQVKEQKGIRLDTNYYFWPPAWVNDRPGFFTGSGMPMRFADLDGSMFDVYQATTQMTDESGQTYPYTINTLLARALGPEGFYGVFTANMHSDSLNSSGSDAIVAAALANSVPVVSGRQMVEWLDGRNSSSFNNLSWSAYKLSFTVSIGEGANGLQVMLPIQSAVGPLSAVTVDGNPVSYEQETIKGVAYAIFAAQAGAYEADYSPDTTPPVISNLTAAPKADGTALITWDTDEVADSAVEYGLAPDNLNSSAVNNALVTAHSVTLSGLAPDTTYYYRVSSTDSANNQATYPEPPAAPASFTTPLASLVDTTAGDFSAGAVGACAVDSSIGDGALRLPAGFYEDFSGIILPSGWASHIWMGLTGPVVSGGWLTVNGSIAYTTAEYGPGRTLEFRATFGAQSFQAIGFGKSSGTPTVPYNAPPWIMFSTGNDGLHLYARVLPEGSGGFNTGNDKILIGDYLGNPHTYRIDWKADSIDFYVDGELKTTVVATIPNNMSVAVSDYNSADPSLSVDWLRMNPPYASPCSFVSRIFDAGESVIWDTMSWTSSAPSGTGLAMSYRIGNTATPDASWSDFFLAPFSGASLSGASRYIQYQAVLSTSNASLTPVLEDVAITYRLGADTTPPTIVSRTPAPNAQDVPVGANITVQFSEPMKPSTLSNLTFRLRKVGAASDEAATISLAGLVATLNPSADLQPDTVYQVIVASGVQDFSGNPLGSDSIWTFRTAAQIFTVIDTTTGDFSAGDRGSCPVYLGQQGNGELMLAPTVGEEFSSSALPGSWESGIWTGGGSVAVSGGNMSVDGAYARTSSLYNPGRVLEFRAAFGNTTFHNAGFGVDFNNIARWAAFGIGNTTGQLYARINNEGTVENIALGASYLGAYHTYRIEWTSTQVRFYIDGALVYTSSQGITGQMRPIVSDYNSGGASLSVDWLRMSPFTSPCTFTSRIIDAGDVVDWLELTWSGLQPGSTSVAFETRTGNTVTPDLTWSTWEAVNSPVASPDGRYVQYRAILGTADNTITPILEEVSLTYKTPSNPTAVDISDFSGMMRHDGAWIQWSTAMELDILGFNLYRATSEQGERIRVNPEIILARNIGGIWGADYEYHDNAIQPGATVFYWLEVIELSGPTNWIGPIMVIAGQPNFLPLVVR